MEMLGHWFRHPVAGALETENHAGFPQPVVHKMMAQRRADPIADRQRKPGLTCSVSECSSRRETLLNSAQKTERKLGEQPLELIGCLRAHREMRPAHCVEQRSNDDYS